jgi:hypothetical protein
MVDRHDHERARNHHQLLYLPCLAALAAAEEVCDRPVVKTAAVLECPEQAGNS